MVLQAPLALMIEAGEDYVHHSKQPPMTFVTLAPLAKRLCTTFVDLQDLPPLLAFQLIALDENPGVFPIGICETA